MADTTSNDSRLGRYLAVGVAAAGAAWAGTSLYWNLHLKGTGWLIGNFELGDVGVDLKVYKDEKTGDGYFNGGVSGDVDLFGGHFIGTAKIQHSKLAEATPGCLGYGEPSRTVVLALLRLLEQPSAEFQDALLTLLRTMLDLLHLSDARVCARSKRGDVGAAR